MQLYRYQRHRVDSILKEVFPFLLRLIVTMPTLRKTSLLLCKAEYRLKDKSKSKEDLHTEKQRSILQLQT